MTGAHTDFSERMKPAAAAVLAQADNISKAIVENKTGEIEELFSPVFDLFEDLRGEEPVPETIIAGILDLANELRTATERGIPGKLLIDGILLRIQAANGAGGNNDEILRNEAALHQRYEDMRLIEIAMDTRDYSGARDRIAAFRQQADETESTMLDEMLEEAKIGEVKARRTVLYMSAGILAVLFLISIYNLFANDKPGATEVTNTLGPIVKPVAGLENPLLTRDELRYCKVVYAMLHAASSKIDLNDGVMVQFYRDSADDYSRRCARYRFDPADMSAIDAEMTAFDANGEALKLISTWRKTASEEAARTRIQGGD